MAAAAAAAAGAGGASMLAAMEALAWDNSCVRELPFETPGAEAAAQRPVAGACFAPAAPTPVENPVVVALSPAALALLGLDADAVSAADADEAAQVFAGNVGVEGSHPAAHCYCGHQFGYFSGQLGDGATMYLGETVGGPEGRMEVQFKGAGKTPFSRTADGRKVLRSSLREFVASEAMAAFGVPTTRAGSLVSSDTRVVRDVFYDGHPELERAAVITRIAPSFLRFGSFEICRPTDVHTGRAGPSAGDLAPLSALLAYTLKHHAPHLVGAPDPALALVEEVAAKTGTLVAHWQALGFCHGVLNTDNMSILGLTIDYGPYGFMEAFNPDFVCNGSDDSGRYSYAKQPEMCRWNCGVLFDSLAPLMTPSSAAAGPHGVHAAFDAAYSATSAALFRAKLGLGPAAPDDVVNDAAVRLLDVMAATESDFTYTFRMLASFEPAAATDVAAELATVCTTPAQRLAAAAGRIPDDKLELIRTAMVQAPHLVAHIPRDLIEAEVRKAEVRKAAAAQSPADKVAADEAAWTEWLETEYAPLLAAYGAADRAATMRVANPAQVPRNSILQAAIDAARDGDYAPVSALLAVDWYDDHAVATLPSVDADAGPLVVT